LPENKVGPGRALTSEEELKLFARAQESHTQGAAYYAAIVASNTTMRNYELRNLRVGDVDPIDGIIRVYRGQTKTDAGCRAIPLNKYAALAIARLLERARLLGATEPGHYLFPFCNYRSRATGNGAGSGYDPERPMTSWKTAWKRLTERAGLSGLRFHDLRHHCITRLAEAGIVDQTLMSISGHVSKEMLDLYSHIRIQARRAAMSALETPALDMAIDAQEERPEIH
jgi:integrase